MARRIVTAENGLNLRTAPSLDAERVALMPEGASLLLRKEQPADPAWLAVCYGPQKGFCMARFTREAVKDGN